MIETHYHYHYPDVLETRARTAQSAVSSLVGVLGSGCGKLSCAELTIVIDWLLPGTVNLITRLHETQTFPVLEIPADLSLWWTPRPPGYREPPAWGWGRGETRRGKISSTTDAVETSATSPLQCPGSWTTDGTFNPSSSLRLITTGLWLFKCHQPSQHMSAFITQSHSVINNLRLPGDTWRPPLGGVRSESSQTRSLTVAGADLGPSTVSLAGPGEMRGWRRASSSLTSAS